MAEVVVQPVFVNPVHLYSFTGRQYGELRPLLLWPRKSASLFFSPPHFLFFIHLSVRGSLSGLSKKIDPLVPRNVPVMLSSTATRSHAEKPFRLVPVPVETATPPKDSTLIIFTGNIPANALLLVIVPSNSLGSITSVNTLKPSMRTNRSRTKR